MKGGAIVSLVSTEETDAQVFTLFCVELSSNRSPGAESVGMTGPSGTEGQCSELEFVL